MSSDSIQEENEINIDFDFDLIIWDLFFAGEANRNCTTSSFRCPNNGNCIPQVWVCDGDADCDGGADERDCAALLNRTCPPTQHRCGNGACLPSEWRCDGDPDCLDMSDEMGCGQTGDGSADSATDRECPNDEFQCASGHCIKGAYRCDGEIHCRYMNLYLKRNTYRVSRSGGDGIQKRFGGSGCGGYSFLL